MTEDLRFVAADLARVAHKVLLLQAENDRLKTENENLRENVQKFAEKHYETAPEGIASESRPRGASRAKDSITLADAPSGAGDVA
jgi:regulator of replication initiation timing